MNNTEKSDIKRTLGTAMTIGGLALAAIGSINTVMKVNEYQYVSGPQIERVLRHSPDYIEKEAINSAVYLMGLPLLVAGAGRFVKRSGERSR
jgi:hypothetical protein